MKKLFFDGKNLLLAKLRLVSHIQRANRISIYIIIYKPGRIKYPILSAAKNLNTIFT